MSAWITLGLIALSGIGIYLTRHQHQPILTYKRDADGYPVRPAVIVWVCSECLKELGETTQERAA